MNATPGRGDLACQFGLAASYVLLALAIRGLFDGKPGVSFVWAACGIGLPLVYLRGYRGLIGAFAGVVAGFLVLGQPFDYAVLAAVRHGVVIAACVWLLRREGGFDDRLVALGDFFRLMAIATVAGLLAGLLALLQSMLLPSLQTHFSFAQAWAGTTLGIAITTPLLLIWRRVPADWSGPARLAEVMLVLGIAFLFGQAVFLEWMQETLGQVARGYWMFLFTTWAAVRTGPHGTVLILVATAVQGLAGAHLGIGFFANDIAKTGLANYFFYMLSLSAAGMALATFVASQLAARRELEDYRLHLEDLVRERTERVEHLNLELEAKVAEATAANQAKSRFLANMSHEIRTPMNAIIGLTHVVRRDAVSPRQIEQLDKIGAAAQHLLGIINDILDFSKIEAGKLVLEQTDFELDQMFRSLNAMIGPQAAEKRLELINRIDPDIPDRLRGDRMRLAQVLLNLANNAIKFTEHGSVIFRARMGRQEAQAVTVRFEVSDTGIGISEEERQRLFQAFEQADASTTRKFGGTGLGLAISRRLVELMGGQLTVESEPGRGSTFWFELPLQRAATAGEGMRPVGLPRGLDILIVDDIADAREALKHMLRAFDAHITCAESGEQALASVREAIDAGRPFRVVLMDWAMPGMDGLEAGRRLQQLHAQAGQLAPALILVTAFGRNWQREQLQGAGVVALLDKPVTPSALNDALTAGTSGGAFAVPPAPTSVPAAHSLAGLRGRRLLLAEDNRLNQEVALALLEDSGIQVDVANDGMQAFAMAAAGDYDLILMDMQMPNMDGVAATREIRKLPQRTAVPIIAMTANAFDEDRESCLTAGMNDHLAKPVDPERLYAVLLNWMPRRDESEVPADEPPAVPPAHGPRSLPEALEAIDGLDARAGLRLVRGKLPSYANVLRIFVETQEDVVDRIRVALAEGRREDARQAAHALKGVCGNIGAVRVQMIAATLSAALKEAKPESEVAIRGAVDSLAVELPHLLEALRHALQESPMAEAPAPD